ncbi:hypothetical protein VVD49_07535 [Uliginosibacterium sp. H3]|uniref:FeoB-associated Cys-rich membrane protein n=1 Tax=Uliginosibacterium silvisoli TaxID=3114758 RepID=A0ABU6K296_9RHOO|nr:hypothetical protein [Uliginosibacterium sp. H3]
MSPQLYAALEPLIVGLIVLLAALAALRKLAPTLWQRLTGKSAGSSCHDNGNSKKTDGCNSGCGHCDKASPAATQQSVRIHPRT